VLSENNRKAELSYAYLHAVAAAAGFGCMSADRHMDGAGVDAQINIKEQLDVNSRLTNFSLHIQLKATSQQLPVLPSGISFSLEVAQYHKLRRTDIHIPVFMVLLSLPDDDNDWLEVTADNLVARRCARWVSLRGAADTTNQEKISVHVPEINILTPKALRDLARGFSCGEFVTYAQ
jgi:hypothetical protein